jgi:hypothetical protein
VLRLFNREAPDELWLTDITEHPTREGKLYCCVVRECPFNGGFGLVGLVDSSFERYRERVEGGLPSHCPACSASSCGVE